MACKDEWTVTEKYSSRGDDDAGVNVEDNDGAGVKTDENDQGNYRIGWVKIPPRKRGSKMLELESMTPRKREGAMLLESVEYHILQHYYCCSR